MHIEEYKSSEGLNGNGLFVSEWVFGRWVDGWMGG